MAAIDDLSAALDKTTTDTQKLITDVGTQVSGLRAQIVALQAQNPSIDLSGVLAKVNALDQLVTQADAATAPATPAPSA